MYKGTGISKDQLSDDGEPCILYGELYTKYKSETIREVISKTNINNTKLVRSKANDVIIPCSGETAEDIATARCVLNGNILLGGDLNIIRLHGYDGAFMSYQLNGRRKYDIAKVAQGVSVVHLYGEHMKGVKTINPCLEEQKKIAKLLSLLDERIATQNKIIDRLQSLIKGINQRVFMNNGINYKLGEVCEIRSGYSGNQLLSKKGLKVSRIETISGHKVNLERVGYVASFESSENYKLQVGDILFSNINSVEYIGNTAFIDKDYDLYHGMNLLRLTPNNMVVKPFYLYLLLNTNRMLNRFKTVCNKAVSQASINQTELGKTVVQIPDINAQKQICELYQALYDKLESEKYANSLFQKQKQYLLRQMFI
uniref:restriction endonuclease subunit S n=1 Tax=Prevotella sp. TaxID=59823 RepID=UPI004024EE3E